MVRLNVTALQQDSETSAQHQQQNAHPNSSNNNNENDNNTSSDNDNNLLTDNRNQINNNAPPTTPSTSNLNSSISSSYVENPTITTTTTTATTAATTPPPTTFLTSGASGGIVMVVPQQQAQQQQHQQQTQPQPQQQQHHQQQQQQQAAQYVHAPPNAHVVVATTTSVHSHHVPQQQHLQQQQQQQQQMSPSDGSTGSLPGSPPSLMQQAQSPPQGAQLGPPICAVHHPQQHQQQLAIVAAMHQAHLAATGGSMPHPMHHGPHPHGPPPPPPSHALSPPSGNASPQQQHQQQQQQSQHSQQHSHENSHGPGVSPSGSTGSSVSSISSNGGGGGSGASSVAVTTTAPPPAPPPGPLYIQYPGEFYPAEYYLAPHPHEGICPQHSHHHQAAMCAMPAEYGPTTVQMVSQNRPAPMPVPVQVPQGQVMQQYVNESGTLTHVVLSPQQYQQLHAGQGHIHAPFLTTNGTSHFYSALPAGFPTGMEHKEIYQGTRHTGGPPHYHAMPSGHMQQAPNQQATNQQPMSHSPHSPSPPNSYHKDERSQRQHTKLLRKLEKQREYNTSLSTPAHSPSPRRNELNGHHNHNSSSVAASQTTGNNSNNNNNNINHHGHHQTPHGQHLNNYSRRVTQRNGSATSATLHLNSGGSSGGGGASSVGTSEDGEDTSSLAEDEEENQSAIIEQLSAIQKPEVIDITSRSAKIIWESPVITDPLLINTRALRYNVLLSDRAKECKYKSLYKGESYDCIVQDLQPGQEYVVRLQVHYEKLQGTASEPTEFTTPPCEPDQPSPPKLAVRTKNSIHLRWTLPPTNGAPLLHYLLEYDEGKTGVPAARILRQHGANAQLHFVEVVKTKSKQYTLSKLLPSTMYNFRLAAVNEVGPSTYSAISTYSTAGNPPNAPKPPTLQVVTSSSLGVAWERRQQDGEFLLQMLDRDTGHGYMNVYSGPDCIYECCQLRRATTYSFRLRAENEAGSSPWSNEVVYKTAPERPGRPGKPHAKGKIHGTHFRARWDPPSDTGGADIIRYFLEITSGSKFERIYSGPHPETTCDRLQPGTTYQLRASCEGPAGLSSYSDVAHITSEAIVPAAPPPPYYDNPPGPYAAVLRLDKPDYNGGAPVLEFEVQLRHITIDRRHEDADETTQIVYRGKDSYCIVKDLRPGQEYEVQVRAINRIGAGAWSPWFRFSAAAAPPYQPEMLRVVVKSSTHLLVSWQEPDCNGAAIAEYRLESAAVSCEPSDAASLTVTTTTPSPPPSSSFHACYQGVQTSADLRNLLPYTLYYFRVNACNVAGVSKWSSMVNAKTPAAVPAAPLIEDYEFTASDVTLRWTEPDCNGAPITAYNIECADRIITTPDASTTEYTVGDLNPETPYKFRVQAVNAVGAGAFSANAKFTTLPLPPKPPALECTGAGHNFIKLKWGDGRNLDFTKFYVEMYVARAKEFQSVYSGTNNMCKINKLQERTAYTFRICAGNDRAGIGEYSTEYVFNTSATLPSNIKAPRIAQDSGVCLLGAHANSGGASNSSPNSTNYIPSGMLSETPTSFIAGLGNLSLGVPVTLEWQHSKNSFNDRVDYVLQYAIGKDCEFKKLYRGTETKFTIENCEPGATYQFRVCPIRVTSTGEDLAGSYTTALRYQVPQLLDEIDSSLLSSAAVNALAAANNSSSGIVVCNNNNNNNSSNNTNGNGTGNGNNSSASTTCHHSHHAHHAHHMHHSHNHNHNSHHNSRHNGGSSSMSVSTLHHRSVSASAASGSSSSSSNGGGRNAGDGNTLLFSNHAIGLIPLAGKLGNELSTPFATCDDPNHHHHHHHHHHPFHVAAATANAGSNDANGGGGAANAPTTTLLAAATSGLLSANSPLLLNAAAAAAAAAASHHHQNHAQNGTIRRFVTKLTLIYSNRKRFTDQEKAVMYMVLFLFLTFVFATLVKMFMR